MSLDVRLLEKARELASGIVQARCPACAEDGGDKAGQHLRVYPDGRFGCCVHPKDREHRKRIFALAGDKARRSFTVKVASGKPATPIRSVTASLVGRFGTLGTAISDPVSSQADSEGEFGTLGTPVLMSRAHGREDEQVRIDDTHTCKDFESGVPSVPNLLTAGRMPYLTPGGTLVIPFAALERFHWWRGGQSIAETRAEVLRNGHASTGKESHGIGV